MLERDSKETEAQVLASEQAANSISIPQGEAIDTDIIISEEGRRKSKIKVFSYDFRSPVFLTQKDLQFFGKKQEHWSRLLAMQMASFFKDEFSAQIETYNVFPEKQLWEGLAENTYKTEFVLKRFPDFGKIGISLRLAKCIVNRLLGGNGIIDDEQGEKPLTEIESALIDDFLSKILNEWCRHWSDFFLLECEIIKAGDELFSEHSQVLRLDLKLNIGKDEGALVIAFPRSVISFLLEQLKLKGSVKEASLRNPPTWKESFNALKIPVIAELDCFDFTVGELLHLKPGQVLTADPSVLKSVNVRFENAVRFKGEVGLQDEKIVVNLIPYGDRSVE